MVLEFLGAAAYQYIDDCGKLRGLCYGGVENMPDITLITPPLHPLNIRYVKDLPYTRVTIGTAHRFYTRYSFKVKELNVKKVNEEDIILGLWLIHTSRNDLGLFYIPIAPIRLSSILESTKRAAKPLKKVPRSFSEEPCKFDLDSSKIESVRFSKRVAHLLKQSTMYAYVNFHKKRKQGRPTASSSSSKSQKHFSKKNFFVDETFLHNILHRPEDTIVFNILEDRHLLFTSDNKIRVPRKEIIPALKNYVELMKGNDDYVRSFRGLEVFPNEYVISSDFRLESDYSVFDSKQDLYSYLQGVYTDVSTIHTETDPYTTEPYLLANYNVSGDSVVLIQNVEGGKQEDAFNIARCWYKSNTNPGYLRSGMEDHPLSIDRYDEEVGLVYHLHRRSTVSYEAKKPTSRPIILSILEYSNGEYAAILPLE